MQRMQTSLPLMPRPGMACRAPYDCIFTSDGQCLKQRAAALPPLDDEVAYAALPPRRKHQPGGASLLPEQYGPTSRVFHRPCFCHVPEQALPCI